VTYALVRPDRLDTDAFARLTGLHPDLVRRLVGAGALEADQDAAGTLWFSPAQAAAVGRIQRLRAAFARWASSLTCLTGSTCWKPP
jgi:hypothetical protein